MIIIITLEKGIKLALDNLGEYKIYGQEAVSRCPICGSPKHKFYLNTTNGLYNCKLGKCGAKGNINQLLEHLGLEERVQYEGHKQIEHKQKHLSVNLNNFRDIQETDSVAGYMLSRGISIDTLNNYGVKTTNGNKLVFITKSGDNVVNVSYRTIDKLIYMESGSGQYLWGREFISPENKTLYIAEGRIDALTLMDMGIENVVSMPNGCSSLEWITQEWNFLSQFESIVLLYDNDEAGKKGLDNAKIRLDFALLYTVDLGKYKDINEAYMDDSEFLYKQINSPTQIQLDGFVSLEDVSTSDGVNTELYSCGLVQFDRIFGGVRLGESTIICSSSGTGKTTILCNMVKGLLSNNQKTAIYSGELTNAALKAWLYSVIGGKNAVELTPHPFRRGEFLTSINREHEVKIDQQVRGKLYIYDGGKSDGFLMLKHFSALNKRFGVKFFFIDNLSILSTTVKGAGQYEGEDLFSKALAEFCRTHRAHVFLFAHPTKQTLNNDPDFIGRDGRVKPIARYDQYNIRGSASFANLSHNIMFLMRAKEHEKAYFLQLLGKQYEEAGMSSEFKELRQIIKDELSIFAYLAKNRGAGKIFEDVLFGYDAETRRIYGLTSKEQDLAAEVVIEEDDINYEEVV